MSNCKAKDELLQDFADEVAYFYSELLPQTLEVDSIDQAQLKLIFDRAHRCQLSSVNPALQTKLTTALALLGSETSPQEASRTLLLHLSNNPRLGKSTLSESLQFYEKGQGFPDTDARATLGNRDDLRKHLLALTTKAKFGDRFLSNLKNLVNPERRTAETGQMLLSIADLIATEDSHAVLVAERRLQYLLEVPALYHTELKISLSNVLEQGEDGAIISACMLSEKFLEALVKICVADAEKDTSQDNLSLMINLLRFDKVATRLVHLKTRQPMLNMKMKHLLLQSNTT